MSILARSAVRMSLTCVGLLCLVERALPQTPDPWRQWQETRSAPWDRLAMQPNGAVAASGFGPGYTSSHGGYYDCEPQLCAAPYSTQFSGLPPECQSYGQHVGVEDCYSYGAYAPVWGNSANGWGGRVGAVFFDRDDENHRFFSYDSNNEAFQLLDSQDADMGWAPGVEAHLVQFNPCTLTGIEAVYWGLYPGQSTAHAYPGDVTGSLNGIFNFDQLDYNGATANNHVNGALVHRVRRDHDIHNVELNCLRAWPRCDCTCSPWTFQALAGVRYFKFREGLQFGSDPADTLFTGAADELYYTIDADNDLIGFQIGGSAERWIGHCWTLHCGAKAGIFGNRATARSHIGGAAGTATINNGPNMGETWLVDASKLNVAMVAELQTGLAYQFGSQWRVHGEYRVIGISGVALPTNQIYQDLRGSQDVRLLATNGSLILHGLFAGVGRVY